MIIFLSFYSKTKLIQRILVCQKLILTRACNKGTNLRLLILVKPVSTVPMFFRIYIQLSLWCYENWSLSWFNLSLGTLNWRICHTNLSVRLRYDSFLFKPQVLILITLYLTDQIRTTYGLRLMPLCLRSIYHIINILVNYPLITKILIIFKKLIVHLES